MTLGEFGCASIHNKPNYCVIGAGENKDVMWGDSQKSAIEYRECFITRRLMLSLPHPLPLPLPSLCPIPPCSLVLLAASLCVVGEDPWPSLTTRVSVGFLFWRCWQSCPPSRHSTAVIFYAMLMPFCSSLAAATLSCPRCLFIAG